jgi:hypothetical protein
VVARTASSGRITPEQMRELLPVVAAYRDAGVTALRLGADGSIELTVMPVMRAGEILTAAPGQTADASPLDDPNVDFDSADG